jgi:hypothetical protein
LNQRISISSVLGRALALAVLCVALGSPAPRAAAAEATPVALIVPVAFRVYESSIGTVESVGPWTNLARHYLALAAQDAMHARTGFDVRLMPELGATDAATLQEHIALVNRMLAQSADYERAPWRARRPMLDLAFGEGLAFLHERMGADYLVFIEGHQVKQSAGAVVLRSLTGAGAVNGGTALGIALLDIRNGRLAWFNNMSAHAGAYGGGGRDMLNYEVARATLRSLLEPYPKIPTLAD